MISVAVQAGVQVRGGWALVTSHKGDQGCTQLGCKVCGVHRGKCEGDLGTAGWLGLCRCDCRQI